MILSLSYIFYRSSGIDACTTLRFSRFHYDWDGHDISAPWLQDSFNFLDRAVGTEDMLEHILAQKQVKRFVREGHPFDIFATVPVFRVDRTRRHLLIVVGVAIALTFRSELKAGGADRWGGFVDLKIAPVWMEHFDNREKGAFARDRSTTVTEKKIPQPFLVGAKVSAPLANGANTINLKIGHVRQPGFGWGVAHRDFDGRHSRLRRLLPTNHD